MAAHDYEILDERFGRCINQSARVVKLYEGTQWAEGPAYFAAGQYVIWSDIPNDRIMRYDETDGSVSVFRTPCGYTNGHTVDRQGRLVSCEHGGRRVSRTEFDGSVVTVADGYDGKRLNSPNDVVVKSDDSIWFTDPSYGIDSDYEGHQSLSEIGACNIYRVDPVTGEVAIVVADAVRPNGLAFSPDETKFYYSDTGASHQPNGPRHIRVYDVDAEGNLSGGDIFAVCTAGFFDGFRLDTEGRIWASAGDGVHCYDPDGTLLGKILVPETVANLVFGGPKRNILYICGTTSLYSIRVPAVGAKTF